MIRQAATNVLSRAWLSAAARRTATTSSTSQSDEAVAVACSGAVIVCWHPEKKFPYEMTRPVPREPGKTHPMLKIQEVEAMENLYHFKHERLQRRDLMRLTWTTKHRWFPNNQHRYEDARKQPRERPYL